MTIGERIKELRTSMGITQEELAKLTGYKSRSSIQKIESGERDIAQSAIVAFAKALKTTPAEIMGWTSEQTEKKSASGLSETDKKVLELFNQLKTEDQEMVLKIIRNSLK